MTDICGVLGTAAQSHLRVSLFHTFQPLFMAKAEIRDSEADDRREQTGADKRRHDQTQKHTRTHKPHKRVVEKHRKTSPIGKKQRRLRPKATAIFSGCPERQVAHGSQPLRMRPISQQTYGMGRRSSLFFRVLAGVSFLRTAATRSLPPAKSRLRPEKERRHALEKRGCGSGIDAVARYSESSRIVLAEGSTSR